MNKTLFMGRLVRDPETQTTSTGIKYSRFTIAVDRHTKDDDTADFVPMIAWRQQAEFIEKYVSKGTPVLVEGRFTSSTYQDKDNNTKTKYEITVDRLESLESKAQADARKGNTSTSATQNTQEKQVANEPKSQVNQKETPWDLDL